MNDQEFSKLKKAIQEKQEFRFSGRLQFKTHLIASILVIFFILYVVINTILVLNNFKEFRPIFTYIDLILPYILVSSYIGLIIWYYWNAYQRKLIVNSDELQFLLKNKVEFSLNWKNIIDVLKFHKFFFSSQKVREGDKWNLILIRSKDEEEFLIKPKILRGEEIFENNSKEKMFYLLNSYVNV
jgi:hypothetical protein